MSYFQWDSDLDVHVDKMNDQHKHLIGLMEKLYQVNASGAGKDAIVAAVKELLDFVLVHFQDEEAYMQSINFFGFEAHKKIHQNLLTDLNKYASEFVEGPDTKVGEEFMAFLSLWINTHIMAIDTKYSAA